MSLLGDFDYGVLSQVAHRPWPIPRRPWLMTQSWHHLLFAHWAVKQDDLRAHIPAEFELDTYGKFAWVGIVPFRMSNVVPRGVPALPWLSSFPELNVRTYVRVRGEPGVYFFSLDAGRRWAVIGGRMLNLPYHTAVMSMRGEGKRSVTRASAAAIHQFGFAPPTGRAAPNFCPHPAASSTS